jgi:hypothetical protein
MPSPRRRLQVLLLTCLAVLAPLAMPGTASARSTTASTQALTAPTKVGAHARVVPRTRPSWNRNVRCRATVTTLRKVLGDKRNANGGATFRGGGFRPGIPDRRAFRPPCFVKRVPTFVQLNRVKLGSCAKINDDGDWTCELTDPTVGPRRPLVMSQIHVETDQKFRAAGGWRTPPGGVLLNVQGFVFWDPGHTDAQWHHFSGWEIHSLTAWRRSRTR